jgi:catechol 2,3-dioxygenase-like lactoylglutathione lyase family enzyme
MNRRGVEIAQEIKWVHGGRSLFVFDPDGRRIEFKAPAESSAVTKAALGTPAVAPASAAAPAKVPPVHVTKKPESAGQAPLVAPKVTAGQESAAKMAGPAPPMRGVVETALYVDDLPRATAFYRDVLGLKPMMGDAQKFQAFDSGSGRVLLLFKRGTALEPVPAPVGIIPPHDGQGPLHIAFAIDDRDYGGWCARLSSLGIALESETHWQRGGRSVYFRDVDQHLVELVTPGIWPNY